MENKQNASDAPNENTSENGEVSFSIATRAMPVFATEHSLEDDVFDVPQVNDNNKIRKQPTELLPSDGGGENVSVANSEVVLRNPAMDRQISRDACRSLTPTLKHSSSTSDVIKPRNIYSRTNSKDPKNMILPIYPGSRSRSPYLSTNSQSCDGLDVLGGNNNYGNNNLTSTPTQHQQFSPYIPSEAGVQFNTTPYQNEGYIVSNGDFDSYDRSPRRPLSVHTNNSSHHHKSPTPPDVKKKMFTDTLSTSLSTIYAILIITLGVSFYFIDYLELDNEQVQFLAELFSLTLLGLALLYLLYINIDIALYNHKKNTFEKLMETIQPEHIELKETHEGVAYDVTLHKALALRKQLDHRYCFNKDRHSSNFYLKMGAAGFCFGHLIHSFLILMYRGVLINSEKEIPNECRNVISFIIEVAYPIYSVTLLFFIFKYSNVIINKKRDFHRFGFMHCISSSLCFWLWTIFRETAEYIQNSKYPDEKEDNSTIEILLNRAGIDEGPTKKKLETMAPFRFTSICEHDEMNVIYKVYSPYLYPFSVEYSILVAGIIYIVWVNIGLCSTGDEEHHHDEDTRECRHARRASEPESNITVHADCHASNKGLFSGFIVLVFAIVSVILFFITYNDSTTDLSVIGLIVIESTKLTIMFCMIIAVAFAYFQMVKLDVNQVAHNGLDNFLCLMCLPAFFVEGIFTIIPGIIVGNILAVTGTICELIQVVIQTTFIIDGMARSSNTKNLRKKKPGREFVTFLAICNVAMWIMQTFEVKSHGLDQYRQDFYSKEVWSIVGHMCLPLMMFYRFHSSVCIVDIWKYAYMPSGH